MWHVTITERDNFDDDVDDFDQLSCTMLARSILYLSQHRCLREIICLRHSNQPLWRASHSCNPEKARHPFSSRAFSSGRGIRDQSKAATQEADSNVDVGHSKFLAEAPPDAEWSGPSNNGLDSSNESHDGTKVEMQATSSGSGVYIIGISWS